MGLRIDDVLASSPFMTRYGCELLRGFGHFPEDREGVQLCLAETTFDFNCTPSGFRVMGSPEEEAWRCHQSISGFLVQPKGDHRELIGLDCPISFNGPDAQSEGMSLRQHLLGHSLTTSDVVAVFERRFEREDREGKSPFCADELIVHDCRTPAYNWPKLRRRIEEALRKTAGREELLVTAMSLGVKVI